MYGQLKVFAGRSHPNLSRSICAELGIPLGNARLVTFSNDNLLVQVEENVRGCDVFVIQTSTPPVSEGIVELLIMIDALRHASAARITAVLPYFPYVRSDKKDRPRVSITARLMADLITAAGADRVLTMELHSPQIQGFFRIPVDQLKGVRTICDHWSRQDLRDTVLVSGDAGRAKELSSYAERLHLPMAIVDKRRYGDDEKPKAHGVFGEIDGKHCLILDDEVASGGTLVEAAELLTRIGARSASATCIHAVLSGDAAARISSSPIRELVVTDTLPPRAGAFEKLTVLTVAPLFADAIRRIHTGDSVSDLFC